MFPSVAVLSESNVIETSGVTFPYMLAVAQQINLAFVVHAPKYALKNIVRYVAAMAKPSAMDAKPLQLDMTLLMLVFADRARWNNRS
nr:hypothetical protein [Geminicoccus flavidas]